MLAATAHLRHDTLRLVLARAEFEHHLHLPSLHRSLGSGYRGSTALRAAMAAHLPQLARCESRLEIDFVLLCERFRIEIPEPNPRIGRWRPDMLWRSHRLIAELDGEDAHSSSAQLIRDARREAELLSRGFSVIRFTWEEAHLRPGWVAAKVRDALTQ